jgi:hypothetical protein
MPTLNQYNTNASGGLLSYSIIESPLIEPLDGPLLIDHLIQRFPEAIYSRSRETHLYRFLTAIAGDAGAGQLKKQSVYARMKSEGTLLSFEDLDGSYKTFGFARLPNEIYSINAKESHLTTEEWDAIRAADNSYRRRIMDFYQATRYGGSPEGMRLASSAGSGQETAVTENYKAIFDSISDDPLGIQRSGNTNSLAEFVIRPKIHQNQNNVERYATLVITPNEVFSDSDYFVFSYGSGESSTPVHLKNVTSAILESAIVGLEIVELNEVSVAQLTSTGYKISFLNPDLDVLNLKIASASLLSGAKIEISYSFIDGTFYTTDFGTPRHEYYDMAVSGLVPNGTVFNQETGVWLDPAYERNMNDVVDRIKPSSTIFTFKSTEERKIQVAINSVTATTEKFVLNRFIKGNPEIDYSVYSPIDGLYITPSFESEERVLPMMGYDFPVISLTIDNVISYRGFAINRLVYNTNDFYRQENLNLYSSYSFGSGFSAKERLLYPALGIASQNPSAEFTALKSLPDYTTQGTVTTKIVI